MATFNSQTPNQEKKSDDSAFIAIAIIIFLILTASIWIWPLMDGLSAFNRLTGRDPLSRMYKQQISACRKLKVPASYEKISDCHKIVADSETNYSSTYEVRYNTHQTYAIARQQLTEIAQASGYKGISTPDTNYKEYPRVRTNLAVSPSPETAAILSIQSTAPADNATPESVENAPYILTVWYKSR